MKIRLLTTLAGASFLMMVAPGIAEEQPAVKPDAAAAAAADAVLDRWIEAQGGMPALATLFALESDEEVDAQPSGRHSELRLLRTAVGRYRWEITAPSESAMVMAFDGGRNAWLDSPRLGFGLLPNGAIPSAVRADDVWTANRVRRDYPVRTALPDADFSGQSCHVLEMTSTAAIERLRAFAKDTGQLVRIEVPAGPRIPVAIVIEYSDFRRVGDLVLPFLTRATIGPQVVTVHRLKAMVDPTFPATIFTAPPDRLQDASKVADILRRHLATVGGADAILAIGSRVTHMTTDQVSGGSQSVLTISQKLPGLILVEDDTAGIGRSAKGYDGHTAWSNTDLQGYRTLKGAELQQLLGQADLHHEVTFASACPLRRYLGTRDVNGRHAEVVAMATLSAPTGTYYFDRQDCSLLRVESALFGDAKTTLPVTVDFSDYRAVDGVKIPFVTTAMNPGITMVTTVQSVENNVPLDDALFKPRHDE